MIKHIKIIHNSKLLHSNNDDKFLKACRNIASVKNEEALELLIEVFDIRDNFTYLIRKELIEIFVDIGKLNSEKIKENIYKYNIFNSILAQAYFRICENNELDFLISLFEKTNNSILISSAANLDFPETAKWLMSMIEDTRFIYKKEALESLKMIKFNNKKSIFTDFLDNANAALRFDAAVYLKDKYDSYDELIKFKIKFSLKKWKEIINNKMSDNLYDYVLKFTDDNEPEVRINVLKLLIDSKKIEYPIAVKFLWDENHEIRSIIGHYLLKDNNYAGEIIYLLNDENADVRRNIENEIVDNINDVIIEKAAEIFEIEINNSRNLYLITALQNLFVLSGERCVDKLWPMISDRNMELSDSILEVFEEIESNAICNHMYQLAESNNEEMVKKALEVLRFQKKFADNDKIRSIANKFRNTELMALAEEIIMSS